MEKLSKRAFLWKCKRHMWWLEGKLGGKRLDLHDCIVADLDGVDFSKLSLKYAQFSRVNFVGLNMAGADLRETEFHRCVFRACVFTSAKWEYSRIRRCQFHDTQFDCSDFNKVEMGSNDFDGCSMRWVTAAHSVLSVCRFNEVDLTEAVFAFSDLRGSFFYNVEIFDTSFDSSILIHVSFNATRGNASFKEALGNGVNVKTHHTTRYVITYTDTMLFIGCQAHPIDRWKQFSDDEIRSMDRYPHTLDWWREHQQQIFDMIERSPARPTNEQNS